jgi:hypothetical protein
MTTEAAAVFVRALAVNISNVRPSALAKLLRPLSTHFEHNSISASLVRCVVPSSIVPLRTKLGND